MNPSGISHFTQSRIEWAIRLRYSPMPELSMDWVSGNLNAHRIGEFRVVGKIWEVMMERDAELATNAEKRYEDVASLDWAIQSDGSPDGDRHAAALKYFYEHLTASEALEQDEVGGVRKLIKQTMSAISYRHSMHEMLLRIDNPAAREVTCEFRHTPVWFFEARRVQHIFDVYGQPCLSGEWLTAVGPGWMRPLSIAFVIKHFPLRDWLLFCTRYGTGFLEGITNAEMDTPAWNMLDEALRNLANDGVILHNPLAGDKAGMDIKFLDQPGKNQVPMQPLVDRIDRLYAKVYRGIDMATAGHIGGEQSHAKATGANVQKEESGIYLAGDANWISETFQHRIDRPIIAYLFNQEPRAKFVLAPEAEDDSANFGQFAPAFVNLGLEIAKSEAREKLGLREPEDGEPILEAAQGTGGGEPVSRSGGDPDSGEPEKRSDGDPNPDTPTLRPPVSSPKEPAVYKKPSWKKATENVEPSIAADAPGPIAPGADPSRSVPAADPNMPSTQVDSGGFWSRAGLAPRGADGQTLPMPSLGYAIPNGNMSEERRASSANAAKTTDH